MLNHFSVYILPYLLNPFHVIIIRTYIEGLPDSFVESAKIDGANEVQVIFRIVLPLITPVLASCFLFSAVFQWNSFLDTYLYAAKHQYLSTLQYELRKIVESVNQLSADPTKSGGRKMNGGQALSVQSIQATMTMVTVIPIVMVYPFLQRYFISGLRIGGVKE